MGNGTSTGGETNPHRRLFTTRRELTTTDAPVQLRFVECIYPGSPRWWSDEWVKHGGQKLGRLNRAQSVADLMTKSCGAVANLRNQKFTSYYTNNTPFLVSCVNPECKLRSWFKVWSETSNGPRKKLGLYKEYIRKSFESQASKDDGAEILEGLKAMAAGQPSKLQDCPQCGLKRAVFGISEISDKYVYVLKESGGSLIPYQEIEIKSDSKGITRLYADAGFKEPARTFDGNLTLPNITHATWHFFLSPVRLGNQALQLLQQAPNKNPQYTKSRNAAKPADQGVGVITISPNSSKGGTAEVELQPWASTVKRKFQFQTKDIPPFEFVPLVDPFSWVAQIIEVDFLPIVATLQKLGQEPIEQDKAFIASALAQLVGDDDKDPCEIKDQMLDIPSGYDHKEDSNIAKAWMHHYRDARDFLILETNRACSRVSFPVRFSLAHRIVETACQENAKDPEYLALGMIHWAHILRDMMICQVGYSFTVWAAQAEDARDRIPQANVLGGKWPDAAQASKSKIFGEIGIGLPVHILAYLIPAILTKSTEPAEAITAHLRALGVETKALEPTELGLKDWIKVGNASLSISKRWCGDYLKKFPSGLDPFVARRAADMPRFEEGIGMFLKLKDLFEVMAMLSDLLELEKKGEMHPDGWKQLKSVTNEVKTSVKIAQYVSTKIQEVYKDRLALRREMYEGLDEDWLDAWAELKLAAKVEAKVPLQPLELQLLKSSRFLNGFKYIKSAGKFLAGPATFVYGAVGAVLGFHEMGKAWESGDTKELVLSGLETYGNLLTVAVALGQCGVEALSGGPLAVIAFVVILIAMVARLIFREKTPLQLFACYCFLGRHYGIDDGDGKKKQAWIGGERASHLASFRTARIALLRLLTGFSTTIGTNAVWDDPSPTHPYSEGHKWNGGYGGSIYPTYVPDGAYFDVLLEYAPRGASSPTVTYHAVVSTEDQRWDGPQPDGASLRRIANAEGARVTRFDVQVDTRPLPGSGPIDFNFRVRLVYDPSGENALPAKHWVDNKSADHGAFDQVSSNDFE